MQEIDKNIKSALQAKVQQIDDDSFTEKIVVAHLAKKQDIKYKPFFNFLSLIIGLTSILLSIGLVLLLKQNQSWFSDVGMAEQHGLILILLSVIYLMYKFMEEFTTINIVNRS